MQQKERTIRFFDMHHAGIERNWLDCTEYLMNEAAVADKLEKVLSKLIGNLVSTSLPHVRGKVWLNRFNTGSQTQAFIQYSPHVSEHLQCVQLVIGAIDFANDTVALNLGWSDDSNIKQVSKFLRDLFIELEWTVTDI